MTHKRVFLIGSVFRQLQRPTVALSLIILSSIVLAIPEFFAPVSGDTAIYAYSGRAIAGGEVLYRDVWDFKTPGIYYLFAGTFCILPDSLLTVRIIGMCGIVCATLLFWVLVKRLFNPKTALILTAFFAVWTNLGGVLNADGPFPETFMSVMIIAVYTFWFLYRDSQQFLWLMLAGVIGGCLIVFKQTAGITLGGISILLLLE